MTEDRIDIIVGHQPVFHQAHGGLPIILPMLWLTAHGATPDEYVEVYERVIHRARSG